MIIDIYSDLVCPWCYIGRHRLERAIAERPALGLQRRWQPFELNPDMPRAGMDRAAYLAAKFGTAERARQIHAVIEDAAERDGIPLRLDRIRRTPSTLDAHRLVRLAARHGRADALVEALFLAYFVQGSDLGDRDFLAAACAAVGLDPAEARAFLETDEERAAVRAVGAAARQIGIQAVPCLVFAGRYALAGAQEPNAILPLLDAAAEERAVCSTR